MIEKLKGQDFYMYDNHSACNYEILMNKINEIINFINNQSDFYFPPTKDCEDCNGTGWCGDNGPGIKGNNEYGPCDCIQIKK